MNDGPAELEIQSAIHSRVLSDFSGLEDVSMQLYCHSSLELPRQSSSHALKRRIRKAFRVWSLNVLIYGAVALADIIGQHLSKYQLYLQDPVDCERNVLYRNPHMISKGTGIVMTDSFRTPATTIEVERLSVGPDLLAQLMAEQTSLPEMEPPPSVTTTLFRY